MGEPAELVSPAARMGARGGASGEREQVAMSGSSSEFGLGRATTNATAGRDEGDVAR